MKKISVKKLILNSLAVYTKKGEMFVAYAEYENGTITINGHFSDLKERS
jgi:hypothetical protein